MKILYGIQLTGNGHITRSIKVIKNLQENGFDVDIITSGTNSQLELPFKIKEKFDGLSFYYNNVGGINWLKTIFKLNIRKFFKDLKYDVSEYDLIISDFEPISAWSAKKYNKKSIGIGNQYSFISNKTPRPFFRDIFSELFIRYFAPCKEHIGINYEKYDEFITLPIINDDLINKKIKNCKFYLVYLPSMSSEFISDLINTYAIGNWRVYSPDVKKDRTDGIVKLKKLNKENFTKDLLNCTGVVTASGFSTTSEALMLGKKLWSIPIKGQYEQLCNAKSLKEMGVFTKELTNDNIFDWFYNYNKIEYKWIDPINDIIKKIKEYAKS
jgi:uncharacterized protein (TIGR00661 family)